MKIKVAIIGLGIMGRRMLEHMGRHESFVPVSIVGSGSRGMQIGAQHLSVCRNSRQCGGCNGGVRSCLSGLSAGAEA